MIKQVQGFKNISVIRKVPTNNMNDANFTQFN